MYRVDSFDVLSTRDPSLEGASSPAARRAPRRRARRTRALRCSSSGAEGLAARAGPGEKGAARATAAAAPAPTRRRRQRAAAASRRRGRSASALWGGAAPARRAGAARSPRAVALELALQRHGAVLGGGGAAVHRFHPLRLLGEFRIRRLELLPQRVHLALHCAGRRSLLSASAASVSRSLRSSARLSIGARSAVLARLGVARKRVAVRCVAAASRASRSASSAAVARSRASAASARAPSACAAAALRRALGARDPPPQRRHRLSVLRLQLRPHDRRAVGRRPRRRRDAGERRRALRLDRRELGRRRLAAVARLPCVAVRGVEPRLELQ